MSKAGSTNTTLEIAENLILEHRLFFAGSIKVTGRIVTKLCIKAGGSIEAGESIEAGWSIEAGESIEAGDDYGIYVGMSTRVSLQSRYAIIKCKTKPENLILGEWQEIK